MREDELIKKIEDMEDVILMQLEVVGGLVSLLESDSIGKHLFSGTLRTLRTTTFFKDGEITLPILRERLFKIARYIKTVPVRQKKYCRSIVDVDRKEV